MLGQRITAASASRPSALVVALGAATIVAPLLALSTHSARGTAAVLIAALGAIALVLGHRWLLSWRVLVSAIVLMILLIPIRRYSLPASLPFELEPYRLAVALIALVWIGSLLIEPATRMRRSGLEGPLVALVGALVLSIAANVSRINALGVDAEVVKKLTFFLSFIVVLYFTASVLDRETDRNKVLRVLVLGGALLGVTAFIEARTNFNPFNHVQRVMPFLQLDPAAIPLGTDERGGRLRAYASAQHSIALGAALAMLVPIAVYLVMRERQRRMLWLIALVALVVGALATVSRTAMVMLIVEGLILLVLKPIQIRRVWPLLVPLLIVVQMAMPGTLGTLKRSFFPEGGLIAEQQGGAGTYGSGRIADLGPGFREWSKRPILGQGFGTRITNRDDPRVNAPILDNQWLGLLLETGVAGVVAILWLLIRSVRRLGRRARADDSPEGWLMAGLAAAVGAFGAGMFTYDAFSFIQVTFLLFILLGLAAPALRAEAVRRVTAVPAKAMAPANRPIVAAAGLRATTETTA